MTDVRFGEGDRVIACRVDRNVVATHQDRNNWNSRIVGELRDFLPGLCYCQIHYGVEPVVDLHNEPLERVGLGAGDGIGFPI